jgi:hypothetical protein
MIDDRRESLLILREITGAVKGKWSSNGAEVHEAL